MKRLLLVMAKLIFGHSIGHGSRTAEQLQKYNNNVSFLQLASYTSCGRSHSFERQSMNRAVQAVLAFSLILTGHAFAATPAPAGQTAATDPAHVKAVQDLLGAMEVEKVLRGVAARSHYQSLAQRQAVFAKLDKTSPAEVYQRLAPALAPAISANTATEMTRFYKTPYGKVVVYKKYNSPAQIDIPGMKMAMTPEEKKERKRAAYVQASKELADAEPVIEHEAFKLLQMINKEKR